MENNYSEDNKRVLGWVAELMNGSSRETALMELSKKREQVPELALIIWHSFGKDVFCDVEFPTDPWLGVMTSLVQEIINVYPLLNPSQLTAAASNRVCNALALLQCVASHNETRGLFLNGKYLRTFSPMEELTLSSTHTAIPLSVPEYHFEISALRVPKVNITRSNRCVGEKRFIGCYRVLVEH